MVEGGTGLSTRARAARRRQALAAAERETRAARLGVSLRSVLVSPRSGFKDYVQEVESRPGSGKAAAILLGGLMGSSVWLLWQKLSGLLLLNETTCPFRWHYLAGAVLVGAVFGMLCDLMWGGLSALAARRLGGSGSAPRFRIVWGVASVPHLLALLVLLPLDLLVVGSDVYRAVESGSTGETAWRAISLALSLSLLVWSLWLLFRGSEAVAGLEVRKAGVLAGLALLCLAVPVVLVLIVGMRATPCPT